MTAAHTPGPWVADEYPHGDVWQIKYGKRGNWLAEIMIDGDQKGAAADARLIASSPDLLEALRQLLGNAIIARHQLKNTEDASLVGSALWDTIGQAEEAIRKATGEAS
jgi:hypothetical protein